MTEKFKALTPHYNARKPVMVIIHALGVNDEDAQALLTGTSEYEASAHYFVRQNGEVLQYVDELDRAWHAGVSFWSGITDIGSISIGIELEARPVIIHEKDFYLTSYTTQQLEALAELVKGMCERHRVSPANILAHQDIAPYRKSDPGPNFNWQEFAKLGLGLWHDLQPLDDDNAIVDEKTLEDFKIKLAAFGYDTRPVPEGKNFSDVIWAFQTHFLPWNICGQVTEQSVQALDILLEKKFAA